VSCEPSTASPCLLASMAVRQISGFILIPWSKYPRPIHCLRRSIPAANYVSDISNKQGSRVGCRGEISSPSALDTRPSRSYLLWGITWVNPAMETDGLSNRPSIRLGNGGLGVNLNGSDPPGAISPEIVG